MDTALHRKAISRCQAWANAPETALPTRLLLAVIAALALTAMASEVARVAGAKVGGQRLGRGGHQPDVLGLRARLARHVGV
jgi:hypothetical protein